MTCSKVPTRGGAVRVGGFSRKRYGNFFQREPRQKLSLVFLSVKTALSFVNYYFLSHVNENALSTSKKKRE